MLICDHIEKLLSIWHKVIIFLIALCVLHSSCVCFAPYMNLLLFYTQLFYYLNVFVYFRQYDKKLHENHSNRCTLYIYDTFVRVDLFLYMYNIFTESQIRQILSSSLEILNFLQFCIEYRGSQCCFFKSALPTFDKMEKT